MISAIYSGTCPKCGEQWEPGDLICSADASREAGQ